MDHLFLFCLVPVDLTHFNSHFYETSVWFVSVDMSYQSIYIYIYALGLPVVSSIVIFITENTNKLHFLQDSSFEGCTWFDHFTSLVTVFSIALLLRGESFSQMSCGYTCPVEYSCVC